MHNTCVFNSFACMHKNKFLIETTLLLEEIAEMYGVYILVAVQATHTFDVNGCDALLHSAQKNRMRSFPAPLCTEHIVRDWKRACEEVCHFRTIQRCFMRALLQNADGEIDCEDEKQTSSESESDCDD